MINKETYVSHDILPAIIEGEGPTSWFDICDNEDAGKNEHSRWEISSIEPNKTHGGVEKDVFDLEEELSQKQGLFSEEGNSHFHLSLPDDTSVQSRRPEVENEKSQVCLLCIVFYQNLEVSSLRGESLLFICRTLHSVSQGEMNACINQLTTVYT